MLRIFCLFKKQKISHWYSSSTWHKLC
jgi:hypothetical protein